MLEPSPAPAAEHASALVRRIQAADASFSDNDRAIATTILRDPFVAAFSTAEQVARASGVSKAAVARFGMRLGYAGYGELRQDLRNRWLERGDHVRRAITPHPHALPKGEGAAGSILATRLAQDVDSLSRLVEEIDAATFTRCAELLAQPGARIHLVGERRGYAVAAHAARLLRWLDCDARLFRTDELGVRLALAEIETRHLVLAFAFRRYSHLTSVVLEHARERGAISMLITDSLECPFVRQADHVLMSSSAGSLLVDSSIPAVFCVEALCDMVIQLSRKRVETHVRRVHERTRAADFDDAETTAELLRRPPRRTR
jgi:DNA-binding MurR/RpiR family transcriptional regulator